MSKGSWTADATVNTLVAADVNRGSVDLQHHSGHDVFIAFGEDPVVDEGLKLTSTFPMFSIRDHRARLAIRGICATAESATGGYATA